MKRATDLTAEIGSSLANLQTTATSSDARSHYDAALAAGTVLSSVDQKARTDVANGERFLASDLVFMDSLDSGRRLSAEVSVARDAELAASEARLTLLRRSHLVMNGGAFALLLVLTLPFLRRRPAAEPVAVAPAEPVEPRQPPIPAPVALPAPVPTVSLAAAADVCVDLARVLDARDVQPLFERAAQVLAAKGLVLWVADGRGSLRPSLAHGYPEKILQRLGSLQADADNVTSLAFRSMQAQVVSSRSRGGSGAIAVPLITSTGCVGVLSAEVKDSARNGDTLSVARMFAAQLATVVGPSAEAAEHNAAQA